MKKKIIIVISLLFISSISFAGISDNAGQSGAQFLKLQPDTKTAAMGNTGAAADNGIEAVFNNPAGLGTLTHMEASLNYFQYIEEMSYSSAAVSLPVSTIGTFGLGYIGFSYGDIPVVTFDNNGLENNGSTSASDLAVIVSCGREINSLFSLGANLKMVHQEIEKESANAYAGDLGSLFYLLNRKLTVGIMVQNLGSKMNFIDKGYNLPLNIQTGGRYKLLEMGKHQGIIAADISQPADDSLKFNSGIEYGYADRVYIRAGYMPGNDLNQFTIGGGLNVPFNNNYVRADYSFSSYENFQKTHRLGLVMGFNINSSEGSKKELNRMKDIKNDSREGEQAE